MAPEQFGAGVLQLAVAAFALAAQPELVEVAADAGAQVPAQGIVITALELVAAEHGDQRVVVHVSAHVHVFEIGRKRGGALGRRGSREGRLRLRRGCRRVIAVMRMGIVRSEEHTSELQSLMRSSYAVLCLKQKNIE